MTNYKTTPAHIAFDLFDALKGANAPGKGRRGSAEIVTACTT